MPTMNPAATPSDGTVNLRRVSESNVRDIIRLEVGEPQREYVAPNSVSIAEAAHTTDRWERAIYVGDVPVGYVLLSEDRIKPRYFLWRMMIDHRYQRRGYGRAAMRHVIDYVAALPGASELFVSYVPGDDGPHAFYESVGFVDTGVEYDGEWEMRLEL